MRNWLISEKIYDFDADEILRDLVADRARSMRKRGLLNLAIGAAAVALSVALGCIPWLLDSAGVQVRQGRIYGLCLAGCGICGIYGAKQLADGVERLLRGARAEGADSDVVEP